MSPLEASGLLVAAFAAGAVNAVAGGGSFLAFPALVACGIDPLIANATNTVALWPGTIAAAGAYRRELGSPRLRLLLPGFLCATALGSVLGAMLLLWTPQPTFRRLIPWLVLAATLLFTFGDTVTGRLARRAGPRDGATVGTPPAPALAAMFLTAVYIGYFGAGAGIVLLALFTVLECGDIHAMNALKTVVATAGNGVAVLTFALAGIVDWQPAALMAVAATAGGWVGARQAKRAPPARVRRIVSLVGAALTVALFRAFR